MLKVIRRATIVAGGCLLSWRIFVAAESLWAQRPAGRAAVRGNDGQETIVQGKSGTLHRPSQLRRGSVLGRFEVPRLKLDYPVLEGTDNATLDKSIGHVEGTGLPGETGNISIAGHRHTHFRKLEWIRRGDEIVISSGRGQFRYYVEWVRLFKPGDIEVLNVEHGPAVTLITCFPFEYVGSAPLRYIVRALPDKETRARLLPAAHQNRNGD